jgi:hypothetical protein
MITCRELLELLIDLDSDGLAPDRRDHAEQHLRDCPSCFAYVESYRSTIRLARQLPLRPLPIRLEERLRKMK